METIKEKALAYEPVTTKNVGDLELLSLNYPVHEETGIDSNNKEYIYKYVEIDGFRYRIPNKVLGDIKSILEANPTTTTIKVIRKGEGLKTTYTVVPVGFGKD